MSVYAYESNKVYFARLCIGLYVHANVHVKSKYTLAFNVISCVVGGSGFERFLL